METVRVSLLVPSLLQRQNCKIIFQNFIFEISKAAWQKAEVFFCAGAGMLTVQKSVKGGRTMQVRSFLLTLGLGMAAGGTVALMLPRQSGVDKKTLTIPVIFFYVSTA
ncbi:MAG: hypothetical protein ACLS4V_05525, partial [Oscillospiraceae bacterium]